MHITLAAEPIGSILGLPITNSIIMTWLTMVILIVIGLLASWRPQQVPNGLQNLVEAILEALLNLVDSIIEDRALSRRVFPLAATFFLLIALANWLGILPGVGTVGWHQALAGQTVFSPLLRPVNADINATLGWAIVSVVAAQIFGVMAVGFFNHTNRFINLKSLLSLRFEGFVGFFVGILELFSELSKMISFSFRLFGNIFAGEVLLTVIAALLPFIVPLPFYFLELFVGLIQAVVFVTLTLVFIKIATTSHDLAANHDQPSHIIKKGAQ